MSHAVARRADRPRLESVAEAEALNVARINALFNRAPEIAAEIEACGHGVPRGPIACAVCARKFRFPLIRSVLRIAEAEPGAHKWATIYLDTIPEGSLPDVCLNRARDGLRQRLRRSGFKGSILIGNIEASWLANDRVWVLHAHLLAMRVSKGSWDPLEERLAETGRADPLDVDELNAPERQISYTFKYVTYHRPGKNSRSRRAQAYPLPPDRLAELACWWAQYSFDDFVFLYGARRRGDRVALEGQRASA